jgi:hypothetical protein
VCAAHVQRFCTGQAPELFSVANAASQGNLASSDQSARTRHQVLVSQGEPKGGPNVLVLSIGSEERRLFHLPRGLQSIYAPVRAWPSPQILCLSRTWFVKKPGFGFESPGARAPLWFGQSAAGWRVVHLAKSFAGAGRKEWSRRACATPELRPEIEEMERTLTSDVHP